MPAKSEKQAKFMRAAAHGWKPAGKDVPSEKVARKFMHTEGKKRNLKKIVKGALIGTALAGAGAVAKDVHDFHTEPAGISVPDKEWLKKATGVSKPDKEEKKNVTEDIKKELESAAKKASIRGKHGGPAFVAGRKASAKVATTPEKKAAKSALGLARGREQQLTKAKEKAETKATKLKKKVGSLKTTQSKSRKLGKELETNVAQRQSIQQGESAARRERGKLFKQGQEIEKKREKTSRVAGSEAERLAANLEHPNLPKLFDRKDLGKETGQKEASPEDVYRKAGIGHTPEEERPGLPAIEKNKKWFKTMLKKHLQAKHVQKPK